MAQEEIPWGWAKATYTQHMQVCYRLQTRTWRAIWERQNGKCAGCLADFAHPFDKDMTKKGLKPEIDHDHALGALRTDAVVVRGLLCRRCNDFLGKIQDSHDILARLQAYLKNPPASGL